MPGCSEVKRGQIYACGECGLRLKAIRAGKRVDGDDRSVEIQCCDKPMQIIAGQQGFGLASLVRMKFGG
ncbi:hypothetical protein ACFLSG_01925 [Candidatus Bipolaricaulota bacterium]